MPPKLNKKAFLENGAGIMIAFILLTVSIVIGANILDTMQTLDSTTTTFRTSNQTFTPLTNVSVALNRTSISTSTFLVFNSSNGAVTLGSGNYTITSTGTFTLISTDYNNSNLNATYQYTQSSGSAYNVTGKSSQALEDYSGLVPALAIVLIAVLIIGGVTAFRRK